MKQKALKILIIFTVILCFLTIFTMSVNGDVGSFDRYDDYDDWGSGSSWSSGDDWGSSVGDSGLVSWLVYMLINTLGPRGSNCSYNYSDNSQIYA